MISHSFLRAASLLLFFALITFAQAEEPKNYDGCTATVDRYFLDEVWAKVGSQKCLTCHKEGGDAEESKLLLLDPQRAVGTAQDAAHRHNQAAFARIAKMKEGKDYRILQKIVGGLDHGGEVVLPADSTGYKIVAEFVKRTNDPHAGSSSKPSVELVEEKNAPPFFAGVAMLDDRRLLRRATLSLAGRLPTTAEVERVQKEGLQAVPAILDEVLKEDAFYTRLREGFNDIFLTVGYDDGAESALAYDHFSKTRNWTQNHDLSHIENEKERTQARYKISDQYREALLREPMKLVEHIVRNDRPFSEIITADYIMISPFTARGYGIYDELKDKFKDPDDPFEFIPVRLKALVGREKSQNQESATGFYPHAGILSTFQYLRRYPTTETNRNRLRARMYFQHFLGIDALELAARVSDAAAVTAKFETPTTQAAECVVCHKTIDPIASLFQDYYHFEGVYGRRKGGWYKDMFQAGFEGEEMPAEERWRSLPWLGERTVKDPRFAVAMVEHVYYILTGRKVLLPPKDLDDPLFTAKRRAYQEQRKLIENTAQKFAGNNFNLKGAFKDLVVSDFYRADGLATSIGDPARRAELDDIGLVHLLTPEQVERKTGAIFGQPWGRLREQMAMLYGGIDSKEVTERAADPSGAMGAIQRILSNDIACRQVLKDFARPASERLLFPHIEATVLPGESDDGDKQIRQALVELHERILGQYLAVDSAEIDRSFKLFAGVVGDAKDRKGVEKVEAYHCRTHVPDAPKDPEYTIRAWRSVVTYLLRRQEFLYE
ncbi:DUF1592 domain-containing protein [Anatilimnocola floriformis]|uniref:DUF1592 domain-containing protein n=1 Tax=Anatilimnocola floriformis TaxID=2948575 RepID=UPI0020C3A9F4|nr:DUF1592 domain-containing protein [Anatilimnocola floriformis]